MAPISYQTITLSRGKHVSPEDGACAMELASMLAGEPFNDHPQSVCPVIGSFLRAYNDRIDDTDRLPLATLWSAYPLFEATNGVAIAHPTAANKAAVNAFAAKAAKYWDPDIQATGGFAYYYTARGAWNAYFDDNGWWGVAFLDAYRATGNKAE